ncbi:hypothetical protein BH23GEM9_BH23GEM9_21250 [soil metagenome]
MRFDTTISALAVLVLGSACSDATPAGPDVIAVAHVALAAPVTELEFGDSAQIGVTVTGADGSTLTDRAVVWTSGDPSVLQVSATGVVTGVGEGSASVTASVEGRTGSVSLTVHSWNIAGNAVVVDSMSLRLVSDSAERAAGRLRFQLVQGSAPSFTAGMVVVGAQGGGFLRRITTVTTSGSEIVLETEPAALADIVEVGGFETSIDLIFAPGVSPAAFGAAAAALAPGQVLWGEGRFSGVVPGARHLPLYGPRRAGSGALALFDLSGVDVCKMLKDSSSGAATCPPQLKKLEISNGSLDFEPDLELEASFSGFSLDEFRGVVKGSLTLDLLLHLEAEGSLGSFTAKPTFFTFTRPFFAQIGPIPVVGYVELELKGELLLKATAKGAMDAGYDANATVEIGASYNGSWSPIVEGSSSFEPRIPSFEEGTLKGNVEFEAKLSLKPRAQIIFYGVIGPFAEAEPFGSAKLTLGTSCGLETNMAVNAAYGFTIPFLDSKVSDFSNDVKPLIQGPQSTWQCPLGTIDVNTTTNGAGASAASAGFTVVIDGDDKGTVASTGQLVVEHIEVGNRVVVLSDVPGNCEVQGGETRTVAVATGNVHGVEFVIDCTELTGEIEVTTRTTGAAPDPDGYSVSIGGTSFAIGINETITVDNIREGTSVVTLSGLEGNCAVSGPNPVDVEVVADETAEVAFDINCAAIELVVRTSTSGPPASTAGWTITLDGANNRSITPNGQVTYTTTAGQHNVALSGLPNNCEAATNPVVVDVAGAGTTEHTFQVQCEGAGLNVSVTTEGDPDPATSYTVSAGGQSQGIGINGSVSFSNLPAGTTSVQLSELPSHCTVQGLNPRTVDVPGSVSFEVVCEQPVQCPALDWRQPKLETNLEENGTPDTEGSTGTMQIDHLEFGKLAVSASAFDGSEWGLSSWFIAEAWWEDYVSFIPVDPARLNESVMLRYRIVGSVMVENATAGSWVNTGAGKWGDSGTPIDGSVNATFDETFSQWVMLGHWTGFIDGVHAFAIAGDGGSSSVAAEATWTLVDVTDSNGAVVPVAQVCTASGASY